MTRPERVEIPTPVYTFYARMPGKCNGGCGTQIQTGDLVTRRDDEFRCNTCAERWK